MHCEQAIRTGQDCRICSCIWINVSNPLIISLDRRTHLCIACLQSSECSRGWARFVLSHPLVAPSPQSPEWDPAAGEQSLFKALFSSTGWTCPPIRIHLTRPISEASSLSPPAHTGGAVQVKQDSFLGSSPCRQAW